MNKNLKVLSSAAMASALAVPAVAGVAPTTADAAEQIESIAFEVDGQTYTATYKEYATATLDGEGELYDAIQDSSLVGIGVGDGVYVSYTALAQASLDNPDTGVQELLDMLDDDADNLVSDDDVADFEDFPSGDVTVENVSAINLKQVEVEFNTEELTTEDVQDTDNYTVMDSDDNDVSVDNVTVNGSTATLTLTDAADNQDEYSVTVDQDAFGGAEDFEGTVEFFDTTIPEVTGADVVGSKTIKVMFSEPINTDTDGDGTEDADLEDAFQLNDGEQFVKDVNFMNNNTEANVEFYTDLEEGTQTISVSNDLEDYAGYSLIGTDLEVEVVEDTEAPEIVGVEDVSPNKATLVFSEEIESGVNAADFYHTNTNEVATGATVVDGNKVELTFAPGDELPNGTAYIYVKDEAITDLWGNQNDQQLRVAAEVEVDETAPSIQDVEASAQNELTVTYDEDVDKDTGSYMILDEEGEELDIVDNVEYKDDEDGNDMLDTLVLSLDDNVYGDHTLVAEDVEDTVGNALDSQEVDFFVEDETKPKFSTFSSTLYQDGQATEVLVVDFEEQMAVSGEYSVLDLSKYIVNGTSLEDVDSASITATDQNTKVRIEVEQSDLNITDGTDELEIGRVADAAGNTTSALSGQVDIDPAGTVDVDTVEATDNNKVTVTLDDTVTDFEADDFELISASSESDLSSAVIGASIDNSGDTSEVTMTLQDDFLTDDGVISSGNTDAGEQVAVRTAGSNVTTANSYGEFVSFAKETATDEIKPELELDNDDNEMVTTLDNDSNGLIDAVVLEYTEPIANSSVSNLTYNVDGYEVNDVYTNTSAAIAGSGTDGKFVIIEVSNSDNTVTMDTDATPSVEQVLPISDDSGNTKEAGTSEAMDNVAAQISTLDLTQDGSNVTLYEDTTNEFTITTADDLDGAYGNTVDVEVTSADTAGDGIEAAYASNTLTITIDETPGTGDNTLASLKTEVEGIQNGNSTSDFEVTLNSNGTNTLADDDSDDVTSTAFTGGSDEIALTFTEDIDASTVDTDDLSTDFEISSVGNEGGTVAVAGEDVTLNVTTADAQVQGETLKVKSSAVQDSNGVDVTNTFETIN
ncbi:Ig-like domain-containing protein [Salimicrobium flavidum]|uniref:Uncharacterized protein n=1 Tax=Salimicrobium flavidum TaxID=570947 RepID=A0A1N7IWI1_9BACI|nr:Ig-like domain-containing protein [Salimicrobium flavidum]SIS41453.1 hypothetical protein SAMN05421687_102364 [Salimicrobium flavidum]